MVSGRIQVACLALAGLLMPHVVSGQCQPAAEARTSQTASGQTPSATGPQFYDEPQFTVAGVADTTNLGGHGSDTIVRTREALAKDTASLGKGTVAASATAKASEAPTLGAAYELAVADLKAGRYEDSRTKIEALLAQQPAAANQAALHHLLGDVEEKLHNPLGAVRAYQRAAEFEPSEPYLFDWGTELLSHRAAEPATEVFAKGNRMFPQSARMLIGLGVAWHARGAYDRAVQCLCQASDLNPSDPVPYLFLGKMQNSETSQSRDLGNALERFARVHPEDALANYYYAVALGKRAKGPLDAATAAQVQALLEKAIRIDPKFAAAHLQLGILYQTRGDFPKAIAAYQSAIAVDPNLEEPHYRLGQVYRQTGQSTKARYELRRHQVLAKKSAQQFERERHEIQQFVISLRDTPPAAQPQQKP